MNPTMLAVLALIPSGLALVFRTDTFVDVSHVCRLGPKQPLRYILNADRPALYVSVDPQHDVYRRVHNLAFSAGHVEPALLARRREERLEGRRRLYKKFHKLSQGASMASSPSNTSFDCQIQVETELPEGDKSDGQYDALSLIIVELRYDRIEPSLIEISSYGHQGHRRRKITKEALYSNRLWTSSKPNFLLSGQLSGFDSIDYRSHIDPQHLISPHELHSTFDRPASISVNVSGWTRSSAVYFVFTSYRLLDLTFNALTQCHVHKEFDCAPADAHFRLCINSRLACDGVPNCGQRSLPNADENCFKMHWSSVLLSLVSYVLLAITLLLCLSCVARVIIQWSIRSSINDMDVANRRGAGNETPSGSFRSSTRLLSFLGQTFSAKWDRPPPTYDEALKHENPDHAMLMRQPPAYEGPATRRQSPPPDYENGAAFRPINLFIANKDDKENNATTNRTTTTTTTTTTASVEHIEQETQEVI